MRTDIDTSVVYRVGDSYCVNSADLVDYGRRVIEREANAREDRLRELQAEVARDEAWFRARMVAVCIVAFLLTLGYIGFAEWQLHQDIQALQQ
ncbi:MAG: hypothetical protein PGN26_00185 [Xylophilus ampelinus]